VQERPIHDHHLAVVAGEVVGGAGHGGAGLEEPQFELAQLLFTALVGVGDERADHDAASDCGMQRLLDFLAIEPEDDDVDRLLGALDRHQERRDAVVWLNDEFHGYFFTGFFSSQTTPTSALGASSTIACEIGSVALSSGTWTS